MEANKKCDAHIDSQKCVDFNTCERTVYEEISGKTLSGMDKAIDNFKLGEVSPAIELSDF